jgi:hypothetical protein
MVAEAHFVVGEKLVMVERVPLIDRAQAFYVDRAMHNVFMHSPLKHIREEESQRDRQPLNPRYVMNVLDIYVERCRAHRVDDGDMEIAIVPPDDAGTVFLSKINLPLADHAGLLGAVGG